MWGLLLLLCYIWQNIHFHVTFSDETWCHDCTVRHVCFAHVWRCHLESKKPQTASGPSQAWSPDGCWLTRVGLVCCCVQETPSRVWTRPPWRGFGTRRSSSSSRPAATPSGTKTAAAPHHWRFSWKFINGCVRIIVVLFSNWEVKATDGMWRTSEAKRIWFMWEEKPDEKLMLERFIQRAACRLIWG